MAAPTLPAPAARTRARVWTVGVAAASSVMMTLDITIVTVALPTIDRDLGLDLSSAQWTVNAYTLAFGALLLAAGSISDRVGRRALFLIGHAVFAAASACCALADSDTVLVSARAVQGGGAALVFGTVMPLVADCFGPDEDRERTRAIGIVAAISGVAAAAGPLLGGVLVDLGARWLGQDGWRLIFAVNLPISVAVLLATWLRVPDLYRRARTGAHSQTAAADAGPITAPVDPPSVVLAVCGLFALNYGILTGPDRGWGSTEVLTALVGAAVLLLTFLVRQHTRGRRAMMDLAIFRIPSFAAISVLAFAVRMFSFGLFPFVILWLSGSVRLSPTGIGLVLGAMALPMLVTAIPAAALQRWFRVGHILGAGMALAAIGLTLGLLIEPGSSWTALVPSFVVIGIGSGLTFPFLMDVAVAVVPPSRAGTATGVANTAFPLGTSCGVAVYGAVIAAAVRDRLPGAPDLAVTAAEAARFEALRAMSPDLADAAQRAFVTGLHHCFLIAAVCALVAAVAATVGIRDRDRWSPAPTDTSRGVHDADHHTA